MGSASHSSKRKKKRIQKKSKKLKLHQNWVPGSDVDDKLASVSMVSGSSSRSEDDNRSKRVGRKRDYRKVSKKKIKRDSSISDSSEDSHPSKKRKRSKKSRKKHIGKKKRRREPSSSFSSDEYESKRRKEKKGDKLEIKERDQREKDGERKRSRHSSRSDSPSSLQNDERLMEENPPKRLKSVIVAMREMEKAQVIELSRDEPKDEIVYEHDDYPSRSNDSNDGTSRGEAFASSRDPSDEKTMCMKEPSKEGSSLDLKMSEFSIIERLDVERSEVSTTNASSSSIDLETMLRQKALENLLKRQGKLPTKVEDGGNQDGIRIRSKVKDPDRCNLESAQKAGINDVKRMTNVPMPIKESAVHLPIGKLETELHLEKGNASDYPVTSRPKLGLSTSTIRLLGSSNTWKRDPTFEGSTRPNFSTPKETVVQDSYNSIESQFPDTKIVAEKLEHPAISRGGSTKEVTKKDEDAEFEQKTMTVMRGGELVQVNYKVKIPKKTSALARRQFKR